MGEKANILVLGTSGAGKSTLINAVIGREEAGVRRGEHGTEKMKPYTNDELNFTLIDSRGFEFDPRNTHKAVKEMKDWLKDGLKDKKPRIHMLWFCVDATSGRFTKKTMKTMEMVKKEWKDVPIIVVLTKSFFVAEDEENIKMVKEVFAKHPNKTGTPIAIIPVLALAPKGENILPRGIEELIQITNDNVDEAVRNSDEAVEHYKLKMKRIYAQSATVTATTAAGTVGAVPIPFPDTTILVPIETGLITGITKIYNIDQDDKLTISITQKIIEAGAAGLVAKAMINALKAIPGVHIATSVLNAIVAGTIVFAIGEATTIIMEKLYKGDIDKENLDWVNDILEKQIGNVIKKITEYVNKAGDESNLMDFIVNLIKDK